MALLTPIHFRLKIETDQWSKSYFACIPAQEIVALSLANSIPTELSSSINGLQFLLSWVSHIVPASLAYSFNGVNQLWPSIETYCIGSAFPCPHPLPLHFLIHFPWNTLNITIQHSLYFTFHVKSQMHVFNIHNCQFIS